VVDVDVHPECLASIAVVRSFFNIYIHLYTLRPGKKKSPYRAHKWVWISAL
jgi:hypothetical protein